MSVSRMVVQLTGAMAVLGSAILAQAAPPWQKNLSANRVDADPKKTYTLKEENGPWMIMACSFSGKEAEKQANSLVLELRQRYKLEAYTHKAEFKLDDPNGGRTASPLEGRAQKWRYMKHNDKLQIDEVAVLVGNYAAVDEPEAQKVLVKLKVTEPDCLHPTPEKPSSRALAALRSFQKAILPDGTPQKTRGPMGHAFITINPLLPPDYVAPKGEVDQLVLRMNKGVTHSLLDCPGRYTVQVARFTGKVIIDQREIEQIENGKPLESTLMRAAEKAHELTEALRMKNFEAYEFHDRYSSIVTVGSFDSVGTPRADGKIEINPKVHQIMKFFGAEPKTINGQTATVPRTFVGYCFDIQPIPVEVPKRSISRALVREY